MSGAEGVTVTPVLVALLTTPVMSSIRASWPAARFEFVRGRAKVVVTGRAPELSKVRLRVGAGEDKGVREIHVDVESTIATDGLRSGDGGRKGSDK